MLERYRERHRSHRRVLPVLAAAVGAASLLAACSEPPDTSMGTFQSFVVDRPGNTIVSDANGGCFTMPLAQPPHAPHGADLEMCVTMEGVTTVTISLGELGVGALFVDDDFDGRLDTKNGSVLDPADPGYNTAQMLYNELMQEAITKA